MDSRQWGGVGLMLLVGRRERVVLDQLFEID